MITSYFMRKVGIPEYDLRTGPAYLTSHATVEQVLPGIMAHMRRMKRVKATEEMMRRTLNSLINEDDVVAIPNMVNPKEALPLAQILQRRMGTVETTVECWSRFYKSAKDLFDHVLDVIRANREAVQLGQLFGPVVEAAAPPPKKRRTLKKTQDDAGAQLTSASKVGAVVPLKALMVRKCERAMALEEWERGQRDMRDKVLELFIRPHGGTPPSSPKAKKGQIVKMTEAELLLHEVAATKKGESHHFDALCNLDTQLPPDTYDPPFDRNDLFLTNVDAARALFQQEKTVTEAAMKRKKQGLQPIDSATFPGLLIVLVTYRGNLDEDSSDMVECNYVTWCCSLDLPTFLNDVLHGTVRLNNLFTELQDRVSRLGDPQWRRRFTLTVVDDVPTLVSESSLPVFLASLANYVELNGGVGRTATRIGLNFATSCYARHQLIYEAGSVQAYRVTWQHSKMKARFEKAVAKVEKSVKSVVDIALTFLSTLQRVLLDQSIDDTRAAAECNALISLFADVMHGASKDFSEARVAADVLNRAAFEKKQHVERAYAAAQVALFRDKIPVPPSLLHAVSSLPPPPAGDELRSLQELLSRVNKRFYKMWFHAKDTKLEAVDVIALLRAMVTLDLWTLPPLDPALLQNPYEEGAAWPSPPPMLLTEAEIMAARNKVVRRVHPDKVGAQPSDEAKWKESTEMTSKVNGATVLLKRFFVGQTENDPHPLSDSSSSVS